MKFAKELERELVPEWRAKYLNYKVGKKKLKALSRALKNAELSPRPQGHRGRGSTFVTPEISRNGGPSGPSPLHRIRSIGHRRVQSEGRRGTREIAVGSSNRPIPSAVYGTLHTSTRERLPLKTPSPNGHNPRSGGYGSVAGRHSPTLPAALELPAPALDPNDAQFARMQSSQLGGAVTGKPRALRPGKAADGDGISPSSPGNCLSRYNSAPDQPFGSFRRMFSRGDVRMDQVSADPSTEVRNREADFFDFLDGELATIESFYKMKEAEASDRLAALENQLQLMHAARMEELRFKSQPEEEGDDNNNQNIEIASSVDDSAVSGKPKLQFSDPSIDGRQTFDKSDDSRRDYVRRQRLTEVPYRLAKRKLKTALFEFYRGLELLKSYADMNHKAFRKMNKKYDKAANARPPGKYMTEKVNKAWFVQSEVIENYLTTVEDLYTRYFERGNRKAAVGKLRARSFRIRDYSPSAFRNGLMLALGIVFGVQGLIDGIERLDDDDDMIRVRTGYLLQIYGGYSLVLLHFLIFCLDCRIWSKSKINHTFVFEFDTRHVLDWRQLAELPCFFVLLEGFLMWLNFHWLDGEFVYLPLLLVCITLAILFFPARILFPRTRKWWAYSNWRLLFSGVYPVEFRDFFLGDMYCSQTYAMGNISLFACLYAESWTAPGQCNSSHSRLMGFFTALPSIWRAFQCLRRYHDTKDTFPHIVNFTKYGFSMLYMMSLSLYRIDRSRELRGIFIFCALVNAIYSSIWDVAMDWSLGNPYSKNPFLRDFLAFPHRWVYYVAMILDPILRFSWIFYAIFAPDFQHSASVTFIVSLVEVLRRSLWAIFRVENEHCTNVCSFRASRDVPLPYPITPVAETPIRLPAIPDEDTGSAHDPVIATGVDPEQTPSAPQRRPQTMPFPGHPSGTLSRVGNLLATAHARDFERRRSQMSMRSHGGDLALPSPDSSTEDDDEADGNGYSQRNFERTPERRNRDG